MLWQEFRQSFRSLRRAPSLAAISIATVALGVGTGTSLFSVVKAVLLNPLPYPDSARLVWVAGQNKGGAEMRTSFPDFDDWRAMNHSFQTLAAYSDAPMVAAGGVSPERTRGAIVSEDFFEALGVKPALGRTLSPEEHQPGKRLSVVVLGHALWQRAYGGDPSILGRQITVMGWRSTVIGVMPPGFAFPSETELWVSARALGEGVGRTAHNLWVIGRLRPGVAETAAAQDVSTIAQRLAQQFPGPYQTPDATVRPLSAHLVGDARTPLLILFAAVGLVILVVCVNVANLLLVRVSARARELAVRTAMGAERRHLARQMLVESLLLASAGGALGLLVAAWSMELLRLFLPGTLPRAADVRIDGGVIAFALAISASAGLMFGTLPAWRSTRMQIFEVLKAGARGQTATRRTRRLQGFLVVSEVALSIILLASAGLLLDGFLRLRAVNPGFDPSHVLTVNFSLPVTPATRGQLAPQYSTLLAAVRALPGVTAAGTLRDAPFDPIQRDGHFFIESRRNGPPTDAGFLITSAGLMEALRIPLVRGRRFTDTDSADSPAVAMISESMARQFWPGRDPIGERIWFDSFEPREHWFTIVGVTGDVRQAGLTEPPRVQAYIPYTQLQNKAYLGGGNLMLRTAVDPASLVPAVRRVIRQVSPEAASSFLTLDDVMAGATARQRFQTQVLAAFALLTLLLAAVGLYGVLSYTVTSERVAIGIRMALGARPPQLFSLVAGRAILLTLAGSAVGTTAFLMLRGLLRKVAFGTGGGETWVMAAVIAVMLAVSLLACWFPARRAMRVDPAIALREE